MPAAGPVEDATAVESPEAFGTEAAHQAQWAANANRDSPTSRTIATASPHNRGQSIATKTDSTIAAEVWLEGKLERS